MCVSICLRPYMYECTVAHVRVPMSTELALPARVTHTYPERTSVSLLACSMGAHICTRIHIRLCPSTHGTYIQIHFRRHKHAGLYLHAHHTQLPTYELVNPYAHAPRRHTFVHPRVRINTHASNVNALTCTCKIFLPKQNSQPLICRKFHLGGGEYRSVPAQRCVSLSWEGVTKICADGRYICLYV